MKKPGNGCLACLGGFMTVAALGAVMLLVLSKLAFSFIFGVIRGAFDLVRDVLLGTLTTAGSLPTAMSLPVTLIILAGMGWLVWNRWQRNRWRDLAPIREEYELLVRLLKRKGLRSYLTEVEKLREKIFRERDRVDELRRLLADDLPRIEGRVLDISRLRSRSACEGERRELQSLMEELASNSARLRSREKDLRKFEDSKIHLASKFNCLRMKLSDLSYEDTDVRRIIRGIDSISFVADIIDQPETTTPESSPTPPSIKGEDGTG
ncbi:MAG: hypothetical protein WA705_05760 [Candidatus Ozemobacteraceae bacterium]